MKVSSILNTAVLKDVGTSHVHSGRQGGFKLLYCTKFGLQPIVHHSSNGAIGYMLYFLLLS